MASRFRAAALAVVSFGAACSAGQDYHDVDETRACLDSRSLLVRQLASERPQQLVVYHPRTEEFVGHLAFYDTDHAAAKAAAELPHAREVTLLGDAIANVVVRATRDERKIRACI